MPIQLLSLFFFFFFNDTATTEIYTLSLHDALPFRRCRRRYLPASASTCAHCHGLPCRAGQTPRSTPSGPSDPGSEADVHPPSPHRPPRNQSDLPRRRLTQRTSMRHTDAQIEETASRIRTARPKPGSCEEASTTAATPARHAHSRAIGPAHPALLTAGSAMGG